MSCGGHRSGSNPVLATAPERAEKLVFEGYGPWSAVTPARAFFLSRIGQAARGSGAVADAGVIARREKRQPAPVRRAPRR